VGNFQSLKDYNITLW